MPKDTVKSKERRSDRIAERKREEERREESELFLLLEEALLLLGGIENGATAVRTLRIVVLRRWLGMSESRGKRFWK